MPHIIIECSANLRTYTDLEALVGDVHEAALATGVFPIGGARTRVAERETYRIADGSSANAFCHVVLNIGHGRSLEVRKAASQAIFAALCNALQAAFDRYPLGISLELREIDPELTYKQNNLHEYVAQREQQETSSH
jgi:5-carboxymethyl-2-hydroxymuconate isomerase